MYIMNLRLLPPDFVNAMRIRMNDMTDGLKLRTMKTILHALSYGNIEVEASRKLADLKRLDPMRIFYRKRDRTEMLSSRASCSGFSRVMEASGQQSRIFSKSGRRITPLSPLRFPPSWRFFWLRVS